MKLRAKNTRVVPGLLVPVPRIPRTATLLAVSALTTIPAMAGIYTSHTGTGGAGLDTGIAVSSITTWATVVSDYSPAPGVGPNFRNPSSGGAFSLGDLYSATNPPATGTEPNAFHAGSGAANNFPFNGNVNDPNDTYGFIGIDAPGSVTFYYETGIRNGAGADLAVRENGFAFGGGLFAELAFVEVSSNGVDFARFPSISLNTAPLAASGTFQGYDMTNIYNLAGKHQSNLATPFNLDDLLNDSMVIGGTVNLANIKYVRLVDVVGNPASSGPAGAVDSLGNRILDNWVTYDSGGFDISMVNGLPQAVGILNAVPEPGSATLLLSAVGLWIGHRRRRRDLSTSRAFVRPMAVAGGLAAALGLGAASAAVTYDSGYGGSVWHTHSNGDSISSYDWGADGNLYYAASTSSYNAGGVFRFDGTNTTNIRPASSNYSGASVVAVGNSVFFNESTPANVQRVFRYDTTSGMTASTTITNYSMGTDGTNLFIAGSADWSTTRITYHAGGDLGTTIDLGGIEGASGPLAFDAAGNLFYAPGAYDLSIYRWSASEVAAAISSGGSLSLGAEGHRWADYSSWSTAAGATSLALDASGNVIVTLTDYTNPSLLVMFDADGSGNHRTILSSEDRLGEVRIHDGGLFVSEGNRILAIVPEPGALTLAILPLATLLFGRRRA